MITIPTKEFITKKTTVVITATDHIPDLAPYLGRAVTMYNDSPIDIRGVMINSWSRWYFPIISLNDYAGYAIYPDASHFWIIGHTKDGYFARQVY